MLRSLKGDRSLKSRTGWRPGNRFRDGAIHEMEEFILCVRGRGRGRKLPKPNLLKPFEFNGYVENYICDVIASYKSMNAGCTNEKALLICRVTSEPSVRARARNERSLFHSIGRCVREEERQRPHTTYT
ncbi:hypothetical protein EVAR_76315_1 [Eumeta japonica]|uniref:Uncharacterized protein n=1 Tax=Eumeta variegata TaxID=151549 RepID=A0A4C1TAE4_EUMVA|nr:hypothetical protein EVAR_76315_1 [Eumeta japonica]